MYDFITKMKKGVFWCFLLFFYLFYVKNIYFLVKKNILYIKWIDK